MVGCEHSAKAHSPCNWAHQGHLKHSSLVCKVQLESTTSLGKHFDQDLFGRIEDFKEFLVIDVDRAFNALLGRPWMDKNDGVPFSYHQCIKYPERGEQGTI